MPSHITMKEVAQQAGVTQATVSLALANHPRIPVATRARIQAVANRLGYRINPFVAALMRMRRQGRDHQDQPVIALINALESPEAWRASKAETVRQMREGALARAAERGYRTEEFWLHKKTMTATRLSDILYARGIQGVLLGPLSTGTQIPGLKWERFATVRLGVPVPDHTLTTVCNDHFFSSIQLMRECWELGYRRPGLVLLDYHFERFQGRWNGGLLVTENLLPGTTPVKPLLLESWTNLSNIIDWLHQEQADVIISPGAREIQDHLQACRWKIPGDVGLASLACPALGDSCSGIFQNGRLIGATGIDTVISMLERNERGLPMQAHTVMIEGVWNAGQTLRDHSPE